MKVVEFPGGDDKAAGKQLLEIITENGYGESKDGKYVLVFMTGDKDKGVPGETRMHSYGMDAFEINFMMDKCKFFLMTAGGPHD